MSNLIIDLIEQSEKKVAVEELGLASLEQISDLEIALKPLLEIALGSDAKSVKFKSDSRVGVLELRGLRVQVKPRLSAAQFPTLLRYALGGQVRATQSATASHTWGMGFENALCRVFCDEINEILRIGLSRKYIEQQSATEILRGRPIWQENFPWLGSRAREISCKFHRLTYDNLDNQLLLEGLVHAAALSKDEAKASALQHLFSFQGIAGRSNPSPSDFDAAAKRYNRLNEHYRVEHGLSKMFLFGLRPESFFESGSQRIFGVVVDMADLFEKFVQRLLEDTLRPGGFVVKSQSPDRGALLDGEDRIYARVRPDFLVCRDNQVLAVIDAKYKNYWPATSGESRPQRKIANEDIYQLFFYQQRLQRLYNLAKPPAAIIAVPFPDDAEREGLPCIPERFRQVKWRAGTDVAGHVSLFLTPMTQFLKHLEARATTLEALTAGGITRIIDYLS